MRGPEKRSTTPEGGLSLVEIIVAMFLLALVALAILPVFASTMKLARVDITVGRAAQIANQQVDVAIQNERLNPNCAAITSMTHGSQAVGGAGNSEFSYRVSVGSCPSTYPGTMTVTVQVIQTATGDQLASANTLVAVASAS